MELLKLNAKLFKIEDGETHYILSKNEQQAREFYINITDDAIKKSLLEYNGTNDINECYSMKEILENTEDKIPIDEEDIIRNIADVDSLDSYTYAMYIVLEWFMQYGTIKFPMVIASSAY